MPDIEMKGGWPRLKWFRDPQATIGSSCWGWVYLAMIKNSSTDLCEGTLNVNYDDPTMRMDNKDGHTHHLMCSEFAEFKYLDTTETKFKSQVVPYSVGNLSRFVKILKGLTGYCAPTELMLDANGGRKPGYENWTFIGANHMEQILDEFFNDEKKRVHGWRDVGAGVIEYSYPNAYYPIATSGGKTEPPDFQNLFEAAKKMAGEKEAKLNDQLKQLKDKIESDTKTINGLEAGLLDARNKAKENEVRKEEMVRHLDSLINDLHHIQNDLKNW